MVTVGDSRSVTRAQAMLRRADETKDGCSGCWRGHYHGSSAGNEDQVLRTAALPQIVIDDPPLKIMER